MPFPPPPPPPPGPPPPPIFAPTPPPAAKPEERNMLLQSIRQGTTLRKTVTNDKSGPFIAGAARSSGGSGSSGGSSGGGGCSTGSSPRSNGVINGSATLGRNNGLAGLFAHGMPKLKPTGVDIGQNNSQSLTSLPSATNLGKPDQTRKQFNVDIKNRGPPPKPPPANQKPTMPQDNTYLELRGKLKHEDRKKSISYGKLNLPEPDKQQIIPRARVLSSASPSLAASPQKEPLKMSLSKSMHHLADSPSLNANTPEGLHEYKTSIFQFPLSAKKFPNAKSPFTLISPSPQSPGVFKFPPPPSSKELGTFPSRVAFKASPNDTTRSEKRLSQPLLVTIAPMDLAKPAMYQSPPPTPNRNEYNRYRDSSMTNLNLSKNQYLPPLPTTPRPKPTTLPSTTNAEFKIQRPHLSPTVTKAVSSMSTSDSVLTGPLHNRSSSTTSLNTNNGSWTQPVPRVMKAPPGGYGKPNVAPKPPGIAAKSPGKLANGRPSVTRAQSMRAPRSPPVAPVPGQMSLLPNQSDLHRGAPMFHQSQDSLLATPPPPKHHTLPSPRTAPPHRPLRPPQTRPPPPPPNKVVMSSPPCPPPPPPTQAPPPPPHRVPPQTHRIPAPPQAASPAPPPPPARHSSMRNGLPPSFSSKLEARFAERFHVKEEFPPPQPFLGITKVYNSRTAKQPAPQPPQNQHILQLNWPRDNTSTC